MVIIIMIICGYSGTATTTPLSPLLAAADVNGSCNKMESLNQQLNYPCGNSSLVRSLHKPRDKFLVPLN